MKIDNNETVFDYSTMNEIINEGMKEEKRKALYKNLWFEKELTILFGETNCGKSLLALQIAEEIAKGGEKVMYFDYEMNMSQLCDRYSNEERTKRYEFSENLIRARIDFDLECDFKARRERLFMRLEEAASKSNIKIFIVDNITCLHPNLSDTEQAARFTIEFRTFMNKLGASILLLGHSPKLQSKGVITLDRLGGSKQISNFIDACFCIGKTAGEINKVYIKQLKARSCPITLHEGRVLVCSIEKLDNCFIEFKEEGYADEKKLLKGEADITPEKEKAHQLYKEGKSYREIAKIIGKSDKTIKKWIEEYEEYCAKHEANEEVENEFFEVDSAEMRSAE